MHSKIFAEYQFLSTLSLRRATRCMYFNPPSIVISIHALLAESDGSVEAGLHTLKFLSTLSLRRATIITGAGNSAISISIHALLAESDRITKQHFNNLQIFLSTLSLRRATKTIAAEIGGSNYFYPRSPCGERQPRILPSLTFHHFYPRSPCGERPPEENPTQKAKTFLSTLSLRRATFP